MSKNKLKTHTKWKKFFLNPTIQWMYVARNTPERAIIVSNISGKFQLHAHDFKTGYDRQITKKPNGALFGSLSSDGQYTYHLNDKKGNEHGHFIRTLFLGGQSVDITPELPPYFSYSISSSDNNDAVCFTAAFSNENRVYLTSFNNSGKTNSTRVIYKSIQSVSEPLISPCGTYTCIAVSGKGKKISNDLVLIENKSGNISTKHRFKVKGSCTPLAFFQNLNNRTVLVLSNASGQYRPVFYDFKNKKSSEINNISFCGDVFVLDWNENRKELLVCDVHKATHSLFIYNLHTKKASQVGPTGGSFDLFFKSVVMHENGSILLRWHDFNTPPRLLQLKSSQYETWRDIKVLPPISPSKYKVENVWITSSDGSPVQMWIVRPEKEKKRNPFIIDIHGGPHGVIGNEYYPEAQTWLTHGFGYCAINYRGSIGFGRKFEEKIYGNPGYWEVEDIVAARNWLVKKEIADSTKIFLSGWSWGGYIALLALSKYPKLWSGSIAGASITDCIMQYEDESAFFKAVDQKRFGGTPKTVRHRYIKSSPTTYAHNIQAPIIMLHGKNDVRCPPRQVKYFMKLLQSLNKKVEVIWFSSGHTGEYTDTKLRIFLFNKGLQFALGITQKGSLLKKKSS